MELLEEVFGIYQNYSGNSLYMLFFLVALLYLYLTEREQGKKVLLVYGSIILLLLFFCPLFSFLLIQVIFDGETYYRILWMLPVNAVIAYSGVRILMTIQGSGKKFLTGLLITSMLIFGGNFVYQNPTFAKAENPYHIPQNVIEVCNVINPEKGEDWVMAVFPAEMLSFVRQYSSSIHMPYGRAVLIDRWSLGHIIYDTMEEDILDVEKLSNQAEEYQCDYIILPESKETTGNLETYQYRFIQEKEGYLIYEHKSKPWEENE